MKNGEDHAENGFGWGNTYGIPGGWNRVGMIICASSVVAYHTYLQNRRETGI